MRKSFRLFFGWRQNDLFKFFFLFGQVNAALLADFLVIALDVVNQLAGSLVDGLQEAM